MALAETIIVKGKQWDGQTCHIFQWLNMLDSKSSHLGGHHLLPEAALLVAREFRPSRLAAGSVGDDGADTLSQNQDEEKTRDVSAVSKASNTSEKKPSSRRLSYILSSNTQPTLQSRVIRMDLFNILLQPAFEFHMASQAYSRRIGCYDRHHRVRGTPEAELEIMSTCMRFEEELQELWRRRPGILSLNAGQLTEFLNKDLAHRLEQLFSVYLATFWGHFLYIHRVAFWTLDHTPVAKKALEQMGNMMRRSVGQPIDRHAFDTSIERTSFNTIHPGLMWTAYLLGCEIGEPVQENWAIMQLATLGKLRNNGPKENSSDYLEPLSLSLDEKGAQNAVKLSRLLQLQVERQKKSGSRVDGKYLCQEMFGCHLYII